MPILDRRSEGSTPSMPMDDAAGRIWARAAGDSPTPEHVAAAAERIGTQLRAGLGRWIGSDGYSALLERSRMLAGKQHPALGGLSTLGQGEAATTAAVGTYGAGAVAAGMMALIAELIELLGGIIGGEMALRLVEQVAIPGPRREESNKKNGRPNA